VAAPATALNPFLPAGSGVPESAPEPAEIRAEMTEITPAMALEWMERHRKVVAGKRVENGGKARDNRKIRWGDDGVAGYARDMRAGKWRRNGETVKIAWDDTIPDGQHRLYACMEAKVPFWCLVVTGVDPEDQDTIDIGIGRKFADQLAIKNEPNAVILASVTRWSLRWLHGVRSGTTGGGGTYKPTQQEMLDFLALTPHLRDAATFAARARQSFKSVRASVYGMAWILFNGTDPIAAQVFLDRVLDGAELPQGHPVLAFRARIWNSVENQERLSEQEQLALMILAWNAWREDRELSRMQLPKGGLTPKNFPEPK
jgi:hypothetical protein